MTTAKLTFVSFKPENNHFKGFLSLEGMIDNEKDPEYLLRKAIKLYERYINKIRFLIDDLQTAKAKRRTIEARKIWEIGNIIFKLKNELEKQSLELDGLYNHLVRDLGVKRKWLEKVIIFRRYIPNETYIPKSLNWGRCEKGTRRIAQMLIKRLPIS